MKKRNVVKVKKITYKSDWFEIKEVEINLDDFYRFEIQYRLGSWYLLHFVLKGSEVVSATEHDFQLNKPWIAVDQLGHKITGFDNLHGVDSRFARSLSRILILAEQYKLEKEPEE